jgi:hypothetical protein
MNQLSRARPLLPEREAWDFTLQADCFEGQIDLKAFCASQSLHPLLGTNPLVLEPQKGSLLILAEIMLLIGKDLFAPVSHWPR